MVKATAAVAAILVLLFLLTPAERSRYSILQGDHRLELGDRPGAGRWYADAARLNPTAWRPYSRLGMCAFVQGRSAEARHHYQQALRLQPDAGEPRIQLAWVCLQDKDFAAARQHLGLALQQKDVRKEAMYLMGRCALDEGRREEARRWWQRTLGEYSHDPGAHRSLGILASEDQNWSEAARHFEAGAGGVPEFNADMLYKAAVCRLQMKDAEQARDLLELAFLQHAHPLHALLLARLSKDSRPERFRELLAWLSRLRLDEPLKQEYERLLR